MDFWVISGCNDLENSNPKVYFLDVSFIMKTSHLYLFQDTIMNDMDYRTLPVFQMAHWYPTPEISTGVLRVNSTLRSHIRNVIPMSHSEQKQTQAFCIHISLHTICFLWLCSLFGLAAGFSHNVMREVLRSFLVFRILRNDLHKSYSGN